MCKSEIMPETQFGISVEQMAQYLCGLYKSANLAHSYNRDDATFFTQRAMGIENFLYNAFGVTFLHDWDADDKEQTIAVIACDKCGRTIKAYEVQRYPKDD